MADRSIKVTLSANVTGYTAALQRAKKSTSDFATSAAGYIRKHEAELNDLSATAGKVGLAFAAGTAFVVKAAMDWEQAWTGVLKTVDGTPAQLAAIEDGLRGLAKETGFSAVEVAQVAENAGQLGVATENIVSFTDTMLALGVSTNLTADEAATSIAQMANVMGTAGGDVDNLASTLVALGNDGASTEAQIIQMAQRIAGAAKTVGMSEADVLAFANTVASLGIDVEAGGTAVSTVISRMAMATQTGGKQLDAFARTAGMSSAQFAKAFKDEPTAAIQTFIEGLGRVQAEGGNVYGILKEIGLSDVRVSQALIGMASAGDLLSDSLKTGSEAWSENTALMDEAGKFYNTTAQQAKQSWAQIKDAAIDAGTTILPVVREILDVVGGMADAFNWLWDPLKTGAVSLVALGGAGLLAVSGITRVATAVTGLIDNLNMLQGSSTKGAQVLGGLGKMATRATVILGVAAGIQAVGESLAKLDADEMKDFTGELEQFGKTGEMSSRLVDKFGKDLGGTVKRLAPDVDSLGEVIQKFDKFGDDSWLTRLGRRTVAAPQSDGGFLYQQIQAIKDTDAALVKLSQSNPEAALQAFERLHNIALEGGTSTERFTEAFSGMSQIVGQAGSSMGQGADAAELLKGGLQDLGPAAQESAEALQAIEDRKQQLRDTAWGFGNNFAGQVDLAKASLSEWLADLEKSATALDRWNENVVQGIRRGVDEGVIDKFREMGPEGARMLDQLVDGSRAGIERANRVFGQFTGGADLAAELDSIPAEVVTQFKTRGERGAIDTAVEVAKAAGLSDRQVTAVLTAMDYASGDIKKVLRRMADADRAKATPTVNVNDQASGTIGSIIGSLAGIRDKTVTVTVRQRQDRYDPGSRPTGPVRRAVGGAVYGPGTETSDSIPALLSKGEHVLTAQDVRRMGGHDAVYRMREQLSGKPVQRFAGGGAVSFRGHTLEYWEDRRMSGLELNQKRREIRDLERDLREREKTKRGQRQKLRGLDRRIAQQELRQAKAELAEALYANRLNASKGGTIGQRIAARDRAAERSKELSDAVRSQREAVAQERESIFDSVKSSLTGGTISGMFDASSPWVNPVNGQSMAAAAQEKVKAVKGYADALGRLARAKAPLQVMQEIAGMGVYAGKQAADALLGDPAALKSISASYAQIDQYAGLAGRYVASSQPFATAQVQQVRVLDLKEGLLELTLGYSRSAQAASLVVR